MLIKGSDNIIERANGGVMVSLEPRRTSNMEKAVYGDLGDSKDSINFVQFA